jgi:hypothetical protein
MHKRLPLPRPLPLLPAFPPFDRLPPLAPSSSKTRAWKTSGRQRGTRKGRRISTTTDLQRLSKVPATSNDGLVRQWRSRSWTGAWERDARGRSRRRGEKKKEPPFCATRCPPSSFAQHPPPLSTSRYVNLSCSMNRRVVAPSSPSPATANDVLERRQLDWRSSSSPGKKAFVRATRLAVRATTSGSTP